MSKLLKPFAPQLEKLERRLFLKRSLSLGALTMLSGCTLRDEDSVDRLLLAMSRFNDRAQAALFDPARLAPTFAESEITTPFPFNAYYEEPLAPTVDAAGWRLELSGRIDDKRPWRIEDLQALPQAEQITRFVCVEGWSAIGRWRGTPFAGFLRRIGADLSARYVGFHCADRYSSSIDMASALHPQTLLVTDFPGGSKYGAPLRLRIPTKLGFKNPKFITEIFVSDDNPGGYWEDKGYNWFSGS